MIGRVVCRTCAGRGWVVTERGHAWPEYCPSCQGRGAFDSVARLARRLGLAPRQLRAVMACKPTRRLGMVVLERIAETFPDALGRAGAEPLFERSDRT